MGRRSVAVAVAVASLLAVSAGCAALVGLEDPSEMEQVTGDDARAPDTTTSPTSDAGTEGGGVKEIGYGSGNDGPVVVTDKKSVNEYAPIAVSAAGGASSITIGKNNTTVTTIPLRPNDVLLLVQSATPGAKPPNNTSPLDTDVGIWELVRVKAVNADVVELESPLVHAFTAPGAQAVRALQAKTVDVGMSGSIAPPKWDGLTGGIVVILATESVAVTGQIDASLSGYRAGRAVKTSEVILGCNANEGPQDGGFSARGEGFGAADAGYGTIRGGRGNLGNGGGGGDCHNAGGGGGGNGGRGGFGGQSWSGDGSRDVGGMPGAAMKLPPGVSRLRFGGGGGAGEGDQGGTGHGGVGGGIIFVRAPKLTGMGTLNVRGGNGTDINEDGAGGGGAGGTIYLDLSEAPSCAKMNVYGGNGGNSLNEVGPGGGGGGGLVFMRSAPSSACPIDATGGKGGNDNGAQRGAGPTDDKRDAGPFVGLISTDLAP